MADRSTSSSTHKYRTKHGHEGRETKDQDQVYLITGASESVVADAKRKNGFYAITIGIRILSLFVVLMTDGWVQIAVFVVGMVAPWIGVQIANNIRQVDGRSIEPIPPQQAAVTAAKQKAEAADDDTVIIGDVVPDNDVSDTSTPSAESDADPADLYQNWKDDDDTGS